MKYANIKEILLLSFGVIMSIGVGCSTPVLFLVFSNLVNDFMDITTGQVDFSPIIHNFAIIGAVTLVVGFLQMFALQLNAKLQARRIRLLLYSVRHFPL